MKRCGECEFYKPGAMMAKCICPLPYWVKETDKDKDAYVYFDSGKYCNAFRPIVTSGYMHADLPQTELKMYYKDDEGNYHELKPSRPDAPAPAPSHTEDVREKGDSK